MDSELYVSDTIKITDKSTFLVQFGSKAQIQGDGFETEKVLKKSLENPTVGGNEAETGHCKKGWRSYTGILLTFVHVLCFSLAALIVKKLHEYHPFSMGIWRFQGLLFPSIIVLISHHIYNTNSKAEIEKRPVPIFSNIYPITKNGNWKRIIFLVLRCIFGTSAILLFFYSLHYITVADALVITAATPVFVTLLAYFFLGETCGVFPFVLSIITIGGVIVISRPPLITGKEEFDRDTLIGFVLGVASMLISVMALVIVRYLKDVHVAFISFAFGLWGTAQSLISSLIIGVLHVPQGAEHIILTIAVALLTFGAQISLTSALKREEAGPVSLIRTSNVIFAFIWQYIFLGVRPDVFSLVGAIIVVFGVIGCAFSKWVSTLPKTHKCRQYFFFVLK